MKELLKWFYRTLSYYIPSIILIYNLIIENLFNKEVSFTAKIGASGILLIVVYILIAIFLINDIFIKKSNIYEKESIKEIDFEKRKQIILKWQNVEKWHRIFKQSILLIILVGITILIYMLEQKFLSLKGTMLLISIFFFIGTILKIIYENTKGGENGDKKV